MVKRFLALATLTAFTGLVASTVTAGCSSTTTSTTTEDAGGTAPQQKDASALDSGVIDDDAGAVCPTPPPAATDLAINPANPVKPGACTNDDVTAFDQKIQSSASATWADLETFMKGRSTTCAACIFSHEADATWGPIVYVGTSGGAFFNFGACYESAPGGSANCGRTLEQFQLCLDVVCDPAADKCGSDTAVTKCKQKAAGTETSCAGTFNYTTFCGANQAALDAKCSKPVDAIRTLCVGAAADGGDAGDGG